MSEFQKGDVVQIKGTDALWTVVARHGPDRDLYDIKNDQGLQLDAMVNYNLELILRPWPVVFENIGWDRTKIEGVVAPYAMGPGELQSSLRQFIGKKTRVTIEVIE